MWNKLLPPTTQPDFLRYCLHDHFWVHKIGSEVRSWKIYTSLVTWKETRPFLNIFFQNKTDGIIKNKLDFIFENLKFKRINKNKNSSFENFSKIDTIFQFLRVKNTWSPERERWAG